jgi:hypothetical protein
VVKLGWPQASVSEEDKDLYVEAAQHRWGVDPETASRLREETTFATRRPVITDIACGEDHRFWLAEFDPSALPPNEGVGSVWRVIDPSGVVQRVVRFPVGFQLEVIQGSVAYGINRTTMGVEYLAAFRIPAGE